MILQGHLLGGGQVGAVAAPLAFFLG